MKQNYRLLICLSMGCLCLLQQGQAQDISSFRGQKPITFTGNLSLNLSTYTTTGSRQRLDPFAWTISGSPTLSIYGVQLPVFVLINQQSKSFQGPFQQFGISPSYKWARAHLGYRNITFSPYTLAGRLFIGAGLELNPGKLRLGFMYGQFQKAIGGTLDQLTATNPAPPAPQFRRMGYAVKVGFGTEANHLDLIYFKAKDDINSITIVPKSTLRPAENAVVGLSSVFTLFKRFTWATDVGLSGYTEDIRSEEYELSSKLSWLKNVYTPRNSSHVGWAGQSSLQFNASVFSLRVQYRLISADYKSMGAYFFNNDLQEITVSPSITLLQGKIQLSGSYGIQNDNVSKTKLLRTDRKIGSANLSIQPSQSFGVVMNYSNYGTFQNQPGTIVDTLKIQQVNQTMMIAPRYFKSNGTVSHAVNAVLSYQNSTDYNTVSSQLLEFNNLFTSLTYSYGLPKQKFTLTPGVNYIRNYLQYGNTAAMGATLSATKTLWSNKLNTSANLLFNQNFYEQTTNGYTLSVRWNNRIRITNKQQMNVSLTLLRNTDNRIEARNFTEFYTNVGYGINF
ncbi:MAG: hypothetical protein U0Y10_21745 [Spirosomataceae bacterium]